MKQMMTKIENELDMLYLSRKLAEIHCQVPIQFSLNDCMLQFNQEKFFHKVQELELKSVLSFLKKVGTFVD